MNMDQYELREEYEPISAWGYVGYTVLYLIPVVGWLFFLIFTFSKGNINRRNYTRSIWCHFFLWIIISSVLFITALAGVRINLLEIRSAILSHRNIRIDNLITTDNEQSSGFGRESKTDENKNTYTFHGQVAKPSETVAPSNNAVVKEQENPTDDDIIEETIDEEVSSTEESPTVTVVIAGKNVKVHSSFKNMMDEYESAMESYISIMSDEDPSIGEMSNAMIKYASAMETIDEIDEDELSEADLAYYFDVINRINQKLLLVEQ